MRFHHLKLLSLETRSAAENMATDLAMGNSLENAAPLALRFYRWRHPSVSFGYFQQWASLESAVQTQAPVEWVRRPTGGGMVDHRTDFTFALTVARESEIAAQKLSCLFQQVHTCLSAALNALGEATALETSENTSAAPMACFQKPVQSDILDVRTRLKLAGSAIHRGRSSLLLQGSVASSRLSQTLNIETLQDAFAQQLVDGFGLKGILRHPLDAVVVSPADVLKFSDKAWTHRR